MILPVCWSVPEKIQGRLKIVQKGRNRQGQNIKLCKRFWMHWTCYESLSLFLVRIVRKSENRTLNLPFFFFLYFQFSRIFRTIRTKRERDVNRSKSRDVFEFR